MERRKFIINTAIASASSIVLPSLLNKAFQAENNNSMEKELKISLAQWSLHRSFRNGELDPVDFAAISKNKYEIDAVEYVNQFYVSQAGNEIFFQQLNRKAELEGVNNLLIMVDDEGDLGIKSKRKRKKAVKNHYKWVDAAKLLNCHSIRINAFGNKDQDIFKASIVDGLGMLCEYAAQSQINVIIENHGNFSSEGKLIAEIVKELDLPNIGTFPDFGNWCTSAKWGSTSGECEVIYDPVQGVKDFLPYAKAVSAKAYDFNESGGQDLIDYATLLKLVKDSEFDGHIGVEYEGNNLSEGEGIKATKRLIEKVWATL